MKTQEDSLSRTHKDKNTKIANQTQIESYFDFSNPNMEMQHYLFLTIEIINFSIIIFALFLFPIISIWKYTWVSVFTGILILSIILFGQKKASYRYLSYFLDIFGLIFSIFIPSYLSLRNMPSLIIILVMIVLIIIGLVNLIFLLNYISIEYSKDAFKIPIIRQNKTKDWVRLRKDKWEDT